MRRRSGQKGTVVIQSGCRVLSSKLRELGFAVDEVDTSEFLKSGGSVFCMKQVLAGA